MFTILACADLQGGKVNLELTFPALPNIGELTRRAEEVFGNEVRALGGQDPGYHFTVNRVQIYDDVVLKWVDLISTQQLHEYDQVYVFQPQTPWHIDTQQDLPAPRPPSAPVAGGAPQSSVHGGGAAWPVAGPVGPSPAHPGGERPNIPTQEKVSVVFKELDVHAKGYLEYPEFERALRERGLDFSSNTLGELFYKADLNRDNQVTFDEWVNWAQIYPNTLETLYFRSKDTSEEAQLRGQIQRAHDQIASNKSRIEMLQRELEQNAAASSGLQGQVSALQGQLAEAGQKRQQLTVDERELLEEEIKMERQRDQMRMQQARFHEVTEKFNRGAASKVCPSLYVSCQRTHNTHRVLLAAQERSTHRCRLLNSSLVLRVLTRPTVLCF